MASQMQEPHSSASQKRGWPPWLLRTTIGIMIVTILAFLLFAFVIVLKQGISQAANILTIISILFFILVAFIGWILHLIRQHHARTNSTVEPSMTSPPLSHPTSSRSPLLPEPSASLIVGTQAPSSSETTQTFPPLGIQEHQQTIKEGARAASSIDVGEAPHPEHVYGRDVERNQLKQWVVDDRCRVVAVLGIAGIGKTTLVASMIEQIQDDFEYVFWRSLQNAPPLENLLQNCLQFFAPQGQPNLPEKVDEQISLLLESLRKHRCLLVLDNFETMLQSGRSAGHYREGYESYGRLLQRLGEAQHKSCLLLTSREKPKEVARLDGKTSPVHSLALHGLGQVEGQEIPKNKGLVGAQEACATLVAFYSGNPLALELVSEPIQEIFGGDISAFLKSKEIAVNPIHDLLEHQFLRLSAFEREILYWLALEREPASLDELQADIVHSMAKGAFLGALQSLRRRSMIETSGTASFLLQPVILEYPTRCATSDDL